MITFQAFLLLVSGMSCVLSLPDSNTTCNEDSPLTIPIEVLNQLTDITVDSKGLLPLWKSAHSLGKGHILTSKYQQLERKACRRFVIKEVSADVSSCDNINSLTHTELAIYYNEFVMQLRVSEAILLNFIEKEIQEKYRTKAEESIQKIIELLDEEILPMLALVLNTTTNDVNCSDTEKIVNNVISLYSDCAVVQTANTYLAQTTLDLYRILISIDSGDINEYAVDDHNVDYFSDGQWCIMQ